MKRREIAIWLGFFAVLIVVGLYFRFYYQPALSLVVSIGNPANGKIYPYQGLTIPITVNNTGSSTIKSLSVGVYVNGGLNRVYSVTLPPGKQGSISFNYTVANPGTINITVIADSAHLYDIKDRNETSATDKLVISNTTASAPYSLLSGNDIGNLYTANVNSYGFAASSYVFYNFGISQLGATNTHSLSSFLYPLFYQLSQYTATGSYSWASYPYYTLYSIWLTGYYNQSVIQAASLGRGLLYSNKLINGANVVVAKLSNGTSVCSWYSDGFTKILAANGSVTCAQALNFSTSNNLNASTVNQYDSLRQYLYIPKNALISGNFTGFFGNSQYSGSMFLLNNTAYYETIASNGISVGSNICYGVISVSKNYYCNTDILPESGNVEALSLIRTTAYINNYNVSLFSLVNSTNVIQQLPINIEILNSTSLQGNSMLLTSGLSSACGFGGIFGCSNITFANTIVKFNLTNAQSNTIFIRSMGCIVTGNFIPSNVGISVQSNSIAQISGPCYNEGNVINGTTVGLNLYLKLNYTISGSNEIALGSAYIV